MKRKIKIGISACLIGEHCRYDGKSKLDAGLKEFLERQFEIVPVCPEVGCGMSVPREPANLIMKNGQKRFITLDSEQDFTEKLANWVENKLKDIEGKKLSGFIFKSKSPSCALRDAKIYNDKLEGDPSSFGAGLFSEAVMKHFPDIVVEDENYLAESAKKIDFLRRLEKPGERR